MVQEEVQRDQLRDRVTVSIQSSPHLLIDLVLIFVISASEKYNKV